LIEFTTPYSSIPIAAMLCSGRHCRLPVHKSRLHHAASAPAPTPLPLLPTLPPQCPLRGHHRRRPTRGSPGFLWPGAPPTPGPSPRRLPPPPWRGSRTTGSMREEVQRLEEKSDMRARRPDPGEQGGVEECADTTDLGQGSGDHCLLSGDILIPTRASGQPERDPMGREGGTRGMDCLISSTHISSPLPQFIPFLHKNQGIQTLITMPTASCYSPTASG
jgi:hypothetical protein